jgi:pimeloyl-ACP methyl ester carboxylesterase
VDLDVDCRQWLARRALRERRDRLIRVSTVWREPANLPLPEGDRRRPTCLAWGERNQVLRLAGMALVRDVIQSDETHVIPDASHLAAREQPQAFNEIVDGFLARHVD